MISLCPTLVIKNTVTRGQLTSQTHDFSLAIKQPVEYVVLNPDTTNLLNNPSNTWSRILALLAYLTTREIRGLEP